MYESLRSRSESAAAAPGPRLLYDRSRPANGCPCDSALASGAASTSSIRESRRAGLLPLHRSMGSACPALSSASSLTLARGRISADSQAAMYASTKLLTALMVPRPSLPKRKLGPLADRKAHV